MVGFTGIILILDAEVRNEKQKIQPHKPLPDAGREVLSVCIDR
jgi:hypothetical protein